MGRLFSVRGIAPTQRDAVTELRLVADSPEAATAAAASQHGMQVLSVQALSAGTQAATWRAQDLAWWCRELKTLLGAGMTLVEALDTLQAQPQGGRDAARQRVQAELLSGLRRGLALSQAMEAVGGFPSVLVASVHAAERTSSLGPALADYLRHHEVLDQLRRKVISAAMYPALVCAVGFLICGFLLLGVLPRFMGILEGGQAVVGGASGALMGLSKWMREHSALAAGCGLAGVIGLVWLWRRGSLLRAGFWLARQVPPVARALKAFELANLYQALALLYRGGYPIEEALGVCKRAAVADGSTLAEQLASVQEAVLRGQGVAMALHQAALTDEVSKRLLGVGERAGGFDAVLQVVAERHAQAFGDFVDRLMRVIEPLLLLLVASAVGSVVVLMYLPIFDIATGLQA
jgi:general secretion pathway protein F